MVQKKIEDLKEKKESMEQELGRLLEINREILKMSETGMLCAEMKRTIINYREQIDELQYQIKSYE